MSLVGKLAALDCLGRFIFILGSKIFSYMTRCYLPLVIWFTSLHLQVNGPSTNLSSSSLWPGSLAPLWPSLWTSSATGAG